MQGPIQDGSSPLRVFGIPELTDLICKQIPKSDNARLLRVCRLFFHQVCPFVWEHTNSPLDLVSMIPSGGIVKHEEKGRPPRAVSDYLHLFRWVSINNRFVRLIQVMRLPTTDPLDLSHFNLYAPNVKHLEIPAVLDVDEYQNWEAFLDRVQSLSLLPNLERLEVTFSGHWATEHVRVDIINLVITFLSSNLRHLHIFSGFKIDARRRNWIHAGVARKLLQDASQKCHRLESMSLFPGEIQLGVQGNILFSLALHDIASPLSSLTGLCTLLITPVVIKPTALAALGQLPSLETLSVVSPRRNQESYPDILEIPDDAFPSLKTLELIGLTWEACTMLCRLKPLVQNLRGASFENYDYSPTDLGDSHTRLISILAGHKSSITQLSVVGYNYSWNITSELIEAIQRLQLVGLTWCNPGLYTPRIEDFLRTLDLGQLQELRLVTSYELRHLRLILSCCTQLRHLNISLIIESERELSEMDLSPIKPQSWEPFCLWSGIFLPTPSDVLSPTAAALDKSAQKVARFGSLFSLISRS
ncbi:hypothetical protein CTheo_3271 [Ceratobasidium theobromae]|uniref:F-box domain-containing protein n=1 Tax=Ceratobasidium theobromae TaxID=1582974 RepID=A0A5N5QNU8_9AGAM|nr:hypothetical protein CTheo_3271 [Ceratobasidium theobromae]